MKISAITITKLYTLEFRGEIETWFKSSYPRWKVERPELITDNLLSFMDDEWLQFVESADEAAANQLVLMKRGFLICFSYFGTNFCVSSQILYRPNTKCNRCG